MYAVIPAVAQVSEQPAPAVNQGGFAVREVTVYSSYYSIGLPPSLINSSAAVANTGYDIASGASGSFSFSKPRERTNFSVLYAPAYTRRMRYTDWSAFSNAVSLLLDHTVTNRLRFSISGAGAIRNREEIQFGQIETPSSNAASSTVPNASNPLAEGLGDTAAQSLFYGTRILTANVRTGVQYAFSPRLSITTGIGGTRMQYMRGRSNGGVEPEGLVPNVTAILGDVGVSYTLTPRTTIGGTFDTSRQQSRIQDVIIMNGRFQIERAMTQHLFVNAYGGAGQFRSLGVTLSEPGQIQHIAGAGVTYRSYAHTILGSFDRRVADIYGVGANSTRSLTGTWRWAHPRSRTWMSINASRVQLQSTIFPTTTWRGTAELGRRVGGNVAIVGSYAYLGYSNLFIQSNGTLSQSAIRIGLTWTPGSQTITSP